MTLVLSVIAVFMVAPISWESHQMNQCVSFQYKKNLGYREGKGIDPGVSQYAALRNCRG